MKTKAYIKNLRHFSLHSNVFDISKKIQYQGYSIKREIFGRKIKVKKIGKM